MPLKGSKSSKGKSTKAKMRAGAGSKKRVEDTLLMDQTAAKAPKLEETIEELNMKNEKIKQVMLGLQFGKWNPHLIKAQIMSLMESFQVNAVDQFNPAHAIPLIIPKNLIKHGMYMTEISNKTPIPILQVRDDAPTNWILPAAGGQHQVAALEIWLEKKHTQLNEYIVKEHALRKQDPANVDEAKLKQWNEGAKKEKDALEGVVEYEGVWLISLFDDSDMGGLIMLDMIDESLALHIAQNETKHIYMESPMEGLIQLFKIMKAQGSDYWQVKLVPQSKGNTLRQRELLRQDYLWDMLSQFDTAGVHYWHANFMLFTEFYTMMMASYGGSYICYKILTYLVACLEHKLCMCFNSVEVDEKEVKILISNLRLKKAEAAQEKLEQLFDALCDAMPISEAISNGIREAIDKCFSSCIANMSGIHKIGNQSSAEWAMIFAQYALEVPQKIQEQMSSWWLPYIYTAKIHPKEWNPGSPSANMRQAMLAHPDYHIDCHNLLWDKIVLVLFESYPAALNMEGQILSLNIPDHMISQSELLNIFGMLLTGGVKKSKPAVPRKGKARAKTKTKDDNDNDDNDGDYIEGL
ncbi:hypothetical protein EDC04DRAFT_2616154 [Pisolithus marmoratus]|nr:hypothetical protein EDC04DRAFT_2616154 [Pisolithus marmoratus]